MLINFLAVVWQFTLSSLSLPLRVFHSWKKAAVDTNHSLNDHQHESDL